MTKPLVLALVGPTASGKSSLAMRTAVAMNGEIICMDSMQVYRGMDIGTAKPTLADRALVPHHLLDVAEPWEDYSVAEYARAAEQAIFEVLDRGRLPVLCGGTGLYLRALSQPLTLGGAKACPDIRARYQAIAETQGSQAVHDLLMEKDPESANNLHPNNLRRVIRALEVLEQTGIPFSSQQLPPVEEGPFDIRPYALSWPRETLYQRINRRFDAMMESGLLKEVRSLLDLGVGPGAQSMQGLGYKELVPYLAGQADLDTVRETVARRTRNYAKRQLTWFERDPRVQWLPGDIAQEEHLDQIAKDIKRA